MELSLGNEDATSFHGILALAGAIRTANRPDEFQTNLANEGRRRKTRGMYCEFDDGDATIL
jgi:hypothetical protein